MELIGTAMQRFTERNLRVPIVIVRPEHTWNLSEPQCRDSRNGTFEFQSSSYGRNTHGTHRNRNTEIHGTEPSSFSHNPTAGPNKELIGTAMQRFTERNLRVPIVIVRPEHTWNLSEPQCRDSRNGTFEFQSSSYARNTHGTYRNRNAEIHGTEPSSSNHNPTARTHMELIGTAMQRFTERNLRVPIVILRPEHTWNLSEPQCRDSRNGTFEFQS